MRSWVLLLHHVIDSKRLTNLYYLLNCMNFAIKYEKLTCSLLHLLIQPPFKMPNDYEGYTVLDY